jgi:hypothetical protein
MADGDPGLYSQRQLRWALILSALLGWGCVTILAIGITPWNRFLDLLPFAAVIGLPIAFLLTFLVGGPVLQRLAKAPFGWLQSGLGGAKIAAVIAAISIAMGRFRGWMQSLDPSRHSRLGGGDFVVEVDGILTPYGWYLLALRTMLFIGLGAMIGLFIRLVIGPGRRQG